jgi:hypothetical protein
MKRDHQNNGLECLAALASLCRRVLATPEAAGQPLNTELEAENFRLQAMLRQRDQECAEHVATIAQLRCVRTNLEQRLTEALREPLPPLYHHAIPQIPINWQGKDASQWHMVARSLQIQNALFKKDIDAKADQLAQIQAAYRNLKAIPSASDKGNAQAAGAPVSGWSSEAP